MNERSVRYFATYYFKVVPVLVVLGRIELRKFTSTKYISYGRRKKTGDKWSLKRHNKRLNCLRDGNDGMKAFNNMLCRSTKKKIYFFEVKKKNILRKRKSAGHWTLVQALSRKGRGNCSAFLFHSFPFLIHSASQARTGQSVNLTSISPNHPSHLMTEKWSEIMRNQKCRRQIGRWTRFRFHNFISFHKNGQRIKWKKINK